MVVRVVVRVVRVGSCDIYIDHTNHCIFECTHAIASRDVCTYLLCVACGQLPREMCARTCCVLRVGILPPAWRVCTHTRSLFCLSLSLPPLLPSLPPPLRRPSLTKIQRMTILQMPRSASHREASHVTARPKTLTTVWMKIHYPGNRHVAIDGGRETYMAAWDDSACHSFLRVRPAEVRGQRGGGSSICLSCMRRLVCELFEPALPHLTSLFHSCT